MTDQPIAYRAETPTGPVNIPQLLQLAALIGVPVARTINGVTVVHRPPAGNPPVLAEGPVGGGEICLRLSPRVQEENHGTSRKRSRTARPVRVKPGPSRERLDAVGVQL